MHLLEITSHKAKQRMEFICGLGLEFSQIIVALKSSHRDSYFNRVVLHVRLNFLKDICKEVQFLVKVYIIDLPLY